MPRNAKIACLQTRPMPDFDTAIVEAVTLGEKAAGEGAQLVATPEYCGGLKTEGRAFQPPAETESNHPVLAAFREFAQKNNVWMVVGSIAVKTQGHKLANRSFVLDNHGEIVARYDKIHMFDIQLSENEHYRESDTIEPGCDGVLVDTPFGRLGLSICYDLRFPHLYRQLAQAGAEIILTPAAFTKKTGEAHWHILNRARAIETGAFVMAPCAIGEVEGGGASYGHSLIINPWGEVLADGGEEAGIAMAEIDLGEVAAARAKIPSLTHDRPINITGDVSGNTAREAAE